MQLSTMLARGMDRYYSGKMGRNSSKAVKAKPGPRMGKPLTEDQAVHLDTLLGKLPWTRETFSTKLREKNANAGVRIPQDDDTIAGWITVTGTRSNLAAKYIAAFAHAFEVTSTSLDKYLESGNSEDLDYTSQTSPLVSACLGKPYIPAHSSEPLAQAAKAPRDDTVSGTSGRAIDDTLFSDCLTGVSIVEWRGTFKEMDECLKLGLKRLEKTPNDFFLRAVLTWAVLRKGTPDKAIALAYATARYLAAPLPSTGIYNFELNQSSWNQTMDGFRNGTIPEPDFVRRHLEDALTRASLLQWLKVQGNSSAFVKRISGIASHQVTPPAVRFIFPPNLAASSEREWVPAAIEKVYVWLDREHNSGLASAFLLWLTGRQGAPEPIPRVLERTCRWIDQYPAANDTLVRWGTIWLAGMANYHVTEVLQQTRSWLDTTASEDDRMVRVAYLWLAGAWGTPDQVAAAIADATKWFENPLYRDDGCLRIAYLLWLMRRAQGRPPIVTFAQLQTAIAETRKWQKKHDDRLVHLALGLTESVAKSE